MKPSTSYRTLAEDTAELHRGISLFMALDELSHPVVFLQSPRGLLDKAPGLYTEEYVSRWADKIPALQTHLVDGTNHYSIVVEERGAGIVAGLIGQQLHSASHSIREDTTKP